MWIFAGRSASRTWSGVRNPKPARGLDRSHLDVADHGGAGHLVVEDVRVQVEHDFLAGARVAHHGDEVAHGAGGDEEPGRLAQALGGQRLQPLDGRVLLPDIVAHIGARHGLAHLRRGERERVGAEVDDVVHGGYRWACSRAFARRPHSVNP